MALHLCPCGFVPQEDSDEASTDCTEERDPWLQERSMCAAELAAGCCQSMYEYMEAGSLLCGDRHSMHAQVHS